MISSPYMFMTWERDRKQVTLGQKHAQFSIQTLLLGDHLIIEPVLICQGRQVVQRQRVFLVRQPEGGERLLFELRQISGNFGEDGVFPAAGKPAHTAVIMQQEALQPRNLRLHRRGVPVVEISLKPGLQMCQYVPLLQRDKTSVESVEVVEEFWENVRRCSTFSAPILCKTDQFTNVSWQ